MVFAWMPLSKLGQIKITPHGKHQLSTKKESSTSVHSVESSEIARTNKKIHSIPPSFLKSVKNSISPIFSQTGIFISGTSVARRHTLGQFSYSLCFLPFEFEIIPSRARDVTGMARRGRFKTTCSILLLRANLTWKLWRCSTTRNLFSDMFIWQFSRTEN